MPDKRALHAMLLNAIASPLGILVSTNDAEKLRHKLYAVRREDESLADLTFILDKDEPKTKLLIVRKDAIENGSTEEH